MAAGRRRRRTLCSFSRRRSSALYVLLGLGAWMLARRVLRPRTPKRMTRLCWPSSPRWVSPPASRSLRQSKRRPPRSPATNLFACAGQSDFTAEPGSVPSEDPGLFVVARRALATGAPLAPAVSGYATALRNEERSRQLTAARRLPVKLLFPLALLILPGFLLLTVGPAVLGSLERLGL